MKIRWKHNPAFNLIEMFMKKDNTSSLLKGFRELCTCTFTHVSRPQHNPKPKILGTSILFSEDVNMLAFTIFQDAMKYNLSSVFMYIHIIYVHTLFNIINNLCISEIIKNHELLDIIQ